MMYLLPASSGRRMVAGNARPPNPQCNDHQDDQHHQYDHHHDDHDHHGDGDQDNYTDNQNNVYLSVVVVGNALPGRSNQSE